MTDEQKAISLDIGGMMLDAAGVGFTQQDLEDTRFETAAKRMRQKRGEMAFRDLPFVQDEIVEQILKEAGRVREKFDAFVVFGIGGSALGPMAVQQALNHLRYNELPKEKRGGPRLYVEDNVDPVRMRSLLDVIDVEKTCFNVISKSGKTSETMSQLLIVTDLLNKKGLPLSEHIIATTDKRDGLLIQIAKQFNLPTFFIPDGVGGRFTELTPVGLLSAAVCGIDIKALLAGAALYGQTARKRQSDGEHLVSGRRAAISVHAARHQHIRVHAVFRFAEAHGGLVRAAVGPNRWANSSTSKGTSSTSGRHRLKPWA